MRSEFNPTGIVHIGDPFVLHAKDGKYYMYATSGMMGFKVWVSTDLKHWDDSKVCFVPGSDSFAYTDFWAPEVVEYQGRYIMHFTARWKENQSLRIGVAVSDSPEGPFIEPNPGSPMFDFGYAAIDGSVFVDDDGNCYMYYSRDCSENWKDGEKQSHIYVVELTRDLLGVKGDAKFLFGPTLDYESIPHIGRSGIHKWNEGPFMVKIGKEYHLMYSCNHYASKYYSICAAKADNPMGEFVKYDAPIATYVEGKVSGPGHNNVFLDENGQMYCAYHVHTSWEIGGGDRQMFIDKMDYKDGKLVMVITY